MILPKVIIHQAKTEAIKRFHPWIFSGAIKIKDSAIHNDELVDVVDEKNNFLAIGYYTDSNIAIRVLSFKKVESLAKLFLDKISDAFEARKMLQLTDNPYTNTYRLVHAEGDGLPGLIIDIYNDVAVIQAHSVFIAKQINLVSDALREIYGTKLSAIYNKSAATLPKKSDFNFKDGFVFGDTETVLVMENNNQFAINFISGQKTGFFIDQRFNRSLFGKYAEGRNVLNTFCYTGGFSVYAAKSGAKKVVSVDTSEKAVKLCDDNMQINNCADIAESHASDVFDFFKEVKKGDFDLIALDPPAFAKNIATRHHALQAYKRLNLEAMEKISRGGILFTFSCSQVVTEDLFRGAVTAAAIEAGRSMRILHRLTQPPDHPVNIFHPEGHYLKGLVLLIN
jgi:23S rRNA (cytosine1962-C5)-methyltransferase